MDVVINVPKYGIRIDCVDDVVVDIANYYYNIGMNYNNINGNNFNTIFTGISNDSSTSKVIGATPCGGKAAE